jgi:hypothetical protein
VFALAWTSAQKVALDDGSYWQNRYPLACFGSEARKDW